VETSPLLWLGFNLFVVVMLVLDLGVFHRKSETMSFKQAIGWSFFWISLAALFNLGLWYYRGPEDAMAFLTGYLLEKSLSVDNLFVFLLLFSYFAVPSAYQHKVLFWGIIGALLSRAIFIFAGVALITKFHWLMYVFGAFLIFTGIRMVKEKDKKMEPDKNPALGLLRRVLPVTETFRGDKFVVKQAGKWMATPLFVALLFVEMSDILFAVDSIPAILAVTRDPFLVYTANVFAILGLRSLYFALNGIMGLFHHLHYGLAAILVFVGVKLAFIDFIKIPTVVSLGFIALALTLSIVASLRWPKKETEEAPHAVVGGH
jgi:tellurite resistance protein TerC